MDVACLPEGGIAAHSRPTAFADSSQVESLLEADARMTRHTPDDLRLDILPPETVSAFRACVGVDLLDNVSWYLAGGTALALVAGHRRSVDLDFFTTKPDFSVAVIERAMMTVGTWETSLSSRGTLYGELNAAKVSFIAYPFFKPSSPALQCGTVRVLSADDIAVMKIIAISQRGRKRDFVDLYWYLTAHGGQLTSTLLRVLDQYPQEHNVRHMLKSLCYFDDAEDDVMPPLFFEAEWAAIKTYFERETPKAATTLLRLT
jgi:hypothetical protein